MDPGSGDLVHYTTNLFAPSRKIYFFSDAPYLLKTARNCLFNSGSGKCTRYLRSYGKYMLWEHIAKLYYLDLDFGLHQLPKLTVENIQLKSFAKMKVSFAVQVLSNTVAQALYEVIPYLDSWKSFTISSEGSFTDDDRGRMFLSVQTFTGLKITVNSLVSLTKFLLSEGFEFVLTERFCQDDVEEYFGYQ